MIFTVTQLETMNPLILVLLATLSCSKAVAPGARIIGGVDAPVGHFPFVAAIQIESPTSRTFCGGSLINHQWILTSANCIITGTTFIVQLGSNTLTKPDPDRLTLTTTSHVIHPDFDPDTIQNDIALIKLRQPIQFTNYIQPINLPTISLLNDTLVTAMGWGQTSDAVGTLSETLQYVTATILSNAECKLVYGDQITENMACVEGNNNEGTCTGDNGSPLIEYVSRFYWVVGIASFLSGNGCESTDPSGYTRVYPYLDWIRTVVS